MDKDNNQLIQKYINSELNETERRAFDQKLSSSEDFREEVHFQSSIIAALEAQEKHQIREDLKSRFLRKEKENKQIRITTYRWAASISIIVLVGISILFLRPGSSTQSLADRYSSGFDFSLLRGDETDLGTEIQALYASENYEALINKIEGLASEEPLTDLNQLLLGIAYFKVSDPDHAINRLEALALKSSGRYFSDALWFLALSHLKNNDPSAATETLTLLANSQSPYKSSAQQLLAELSSMTD